MNPYPNIKHTFLCFRLGALFYSSKVNIFLYAGTLFQESPGIFSSLMFSGFLECKSISTMKRTGYDCNDSHPLYKKRRLLVEQTSASYFRVIRPNGYDEEVCKLTDDVWFLILPLVLQVQWWDLWEAGCLNIHRCMLGDIDAGVCIRSEFYNRRLKPQKGFWSWHRFIANCLDIVVDNPGVTIYATNTSRFPFRRAVNRVIQVLK